MPRVTQLGNIRLRLQGPGSVSPPKPVPCPENPEMAGAARERGPTTPIISETVPLPGSRQGRAAAAPTASFYLGAHTSLCSLRSISASSWNAVISQGSARPTGRARRCTWASPGAFSPRQMSGSRPDPGRPGGAVQAGLHQVQLRGASKHHRRLVSQPPLRRGLTQESFPSAICSCLFCFLPSACHPLPCFLCICLFVLRSSFLPRLERSMRAGV